MGWLDRTIDLFQAGGWAMYPLLALSILSLALSAERGLFWLSVNSASGRRRFVRLLEILRRSPQEEAAAKLVDERSLYARFARDLVAIAGRKLHDERYLTSVAHELIERYRPTVERFSVTLSTIITAAPMLGILGTVTGIIRSFRILGQSSTVTDPTAVAGGVAEALLTTAFGLIVALITLFPYVWARSQSEKCLSRLEALCAAASARSER